MFVFQSIYKSGAKLKRFRQSISLHQSLSELFNIYDSLGGATEKVEESIDRKINRSLGAGGNAKPALQNNMYLLLRAKDIHRYVVEDADLVPLKLRLLEQVLLTRSLPERWAAIREMLLASLDLICEAPGLCRASNLESYKQNLSTRSSRLGKMVLATALFNFDLDEEIPPQNQKIKFVRRGFPDHYWEITGESGASGFPGIRWGWSPSNPLCRWEYLGADLIHAVIRMKNGSSRPGAGFQEAGFQDAPSPLFPPDGKENSAGVFAPESPVAILYCSPVSGEGLAGKGGQMELFPVEGEALLPEVNREIHRKLGSEGVRMLALLLGRLAQSKPGEEITLELDDLAAFPPGAGITNRKKQGRTKKLWNVLERLNSLELTKITTTGNRSTIHSSRLITILATLSEKPKQDPHQPFKREKTTHLEGQIIRLVVDPYFYNAGGRGLGSHYLDIPEILFCCDPKEHPFSLGLFIFLKKCWAQDWETAGGIYSGSARKLFHEAGFWLSDSSRYRSIEAVKRDLGYLKELGLLKAWKVEISDSRDSLDDIYRLEAPNRGEQGKRGFSENKYPASLVSA